MDKFMTTVGAAILTGLVFSSTCFLIGLVFGGIFAAISAKLFVVGMLVGAYNGFVN